MVEYSPRIDEQISEELGLRGHIGPDSIPGIAEEDGAALLERYLAVHGEQTPLRIDEGVLMLDVPPPSAVASESDAPPYSAPVMPAVQPVLSPVDQVLAQPASKSLLDTAASGARVSKAMWLLPLWLGLIGGIIGWAVARDANARVARQLLGFGIAVQVVSTVVGLAMAPMIAPLMSSVTDSVISAEWPPSESGRPTLYYFGTST
ncbi:MAG: hypothetical protein U1E26_11025 [Coriobacteriia bacterium]|nr:hypothetical protein [Coriobacteriia bacterium]